jgi:hypothetical protein
VKEGNLALSNDPIATMSRRDERPPETGGADGAALSAVEEAAVAVAAASADNR